jgi:cysteine desulfuration protein SufE
MTLDTIRSDFAFLDDWEDRYSYVIELGRGLPPLPDAYRTDRYKVRGCASQVWLTTETERRPDGTAMLRFRGDSDAHIVRGLIAILFAIHSGKTADDVLGADGQAIFAELGLQEHLTPQRSNGFAAMVERIRSDAWAVAAPRPEPVRHAVSRRLELQRSWRLSSSPAPRSGRWSTPSAGT